MRTALVTGGARGIGLAIARRLKADGASVLLADIDLESVEARLAEGWTAHRVDGLPCGLGGAPDRRGGVPGFAGWSRSSDAPSP